MKTKLCQKVPLLLFLAFLLSFASAEGKAEGLQPAVPTMKHMTISPQQEEKKPAPVEENKQQLSDSVVPQEPEKPTREPLDVKDALVKPEDLKLWSKLSSAASARSEKEILALLDELDYNRGGIPPQGFFLAARSLAAAGKMEEASKYYLVGQLRLEFDKARWPSHPEKSYTDLKENNARKTEDQALPVPKEPKMENRHGKVEALAASVGTPIFAWLTKEPERLKKALDEAEAYDLSAPYAYDTGYEVGEPVPFEKWDKILSGIRTAYFERMRNLQHNLEKYLK